jgi:NAD(P)-dependent dehydrogenase (short-subunit alcohol dehydrogenase family)
VVPHVNHDQVAVVTGGGTGIGFAVASALADGGYHVVILDSGVQLDGQRPDAGSAAQAARRLTARGGSAEGVACDVADTSLVRAAFADLAERRGRVDVLANVAGILRPGPFLEDTRETWDAVIGTHLGGHINTIDAALPGMLARGSGRIINFTSTAALLGSRRQPAYSTAKESIIGLSRRLASMLAPTGVSVNAVAPAAATRMSTGLRVAGAEEFTERRPDLYDRDAAHIGRFVRWLSGPEAAGISGKLFLASGNYVVEYEHLRLWKWSMIPLDGTGPAAAAQSQLAEYLRWVIGRPHPALIGPWPTRDFRLTAVERLWEGASIGPDLAAAAAADHDSPGAGAVLALGEGGERSASVLAQAGNVVRIEDWPGQDSVDSEMAAVGARGVRAAGSVVFAPDLAQAGGMLPDPGAACSAVADLLGRVRSAVELTAHHDDRGVVIVLPGWLPWLDERAGLARWLAWYAAVGLVRGGAATEAIYGVRVNGLVLGPGHQRLAAATVGYLLSAESSWLNGYVLTVDERGVGLLSDENPRWQGYLTGEELALPKGLLASLSD